MMVAHMFALAKPREIVLAGYTLNNPLNNPPSNPQNNTMLAAIRRTFLPNTVVMLAEDVERPMPAVDGKPTAYVCENFACQLPVTTVDELSVLIAGV